MTIVQNVVIEGGDFNILYAKRELDLKEVVDMIIEVGPEGGVILPGVENLFIGLTRYLKANPEPRLENMFRLCVSGAGPLHRPVKDKFEAVSGGKLVEAYGLSECTTAVSIGPFNGTDTPGTIGLPSSTYHLGTVINFLLLIFFFCINNNGVNIFDFYIYKSIVLCKF
ncbi:hypothetical protein ES705_20392 [subsurface metagenome]